MGPIDVSRETVRRSPPFAGITPTFAAHQPISTTKPQTLPARNASSSIGERDRFCLGACRRPCPPTVAPPVGDHRFPASASAVAHALKLRFPPWRPPPPALTTAVFRIGDHRRPPWRPPSPALATIVARLGDRRRPRCRPPARHRLNSIPAQPHVPGITTRLATPRRARISLSRKRGEGRGEGQPHTPTLIRLTRRCEAAGAQATSSRSSSFLNSRRSRSASSSGSQLAICGKTVR